ncbi:hypothetical protein [Acinetobacter silvestris]|nr:hypothetical protein [Acinetobacter silvestris]
MDLADIHRCYKLKPSRLSVLFQFFLLMIILIGLYQVVTGMVLVCALVIAVVAYFVFIQRDQIEQLEQLDHSEWTISFQKSQAKQTVYIDKMIDHHIYIVIYFQSKNLKPMIIWYDQLSQLSWKSLKMRVELT